MESPEWSQWSHHPAPQIVPPPAAFMAAQAPSRKRSYSSHVASANKRARLSTTQVAGALSGLNLNKRTRTFGEEEDPESRSKRQHSLSDSINATVVPLGGGAMRGRVRLSTLIEHHQSSSLNSTEMNQVVRHQTHEEMFLQLAAKCLAEHKHVFIASPTGTVWKASLIQMLNNGLPNLVPEICMEEFQTESEAKVTY
eukprot:TRINITY_DN5908_c0_g2_i7.p1 TRINITY_DN5908_c0_g2~~TRINITY_DN5908_c0_g2_i7.p1  ORF type:complete len:197 (-),score=45.85 TRINITY_DN5908_c0_g2_i7:818-1408(-)